MQDPECWSEEDFAWSEGEKGKKGLSKCNDGLQKGGFRRHQPDKGAGKDYPQNKGRGKDQQGKGKEGIHPQSRLSASETPNAELYDHAWELDDWSASHWADDSWTPDAGWFCTKVHAARMVATPLNLASHPTHVVLDLGCTRSNGFRAAIEISTKHAWCYGITTEFWRCNKSFANSETETCMESCTIHFPATPPCSTKVDVLETGEVPILFSLSQMKTLGTNIELDPKGDEITCPAFGLYSFPAEYSTVGRIVLDLTNLAYQPTTKSREEPGHPRRHVTFAMSERKPAYPAHAPDMHEDDDEGDKPLVQPASRKEPAEERSEKATDDEDLVPLVPPRLRPAAPVRERKGPPVRQDPTATLEQEV